MKNGFTSAEFQIIVDGSLTKQDEKIGGFQIVVFLLSIIVLCSMTADAIFNLPKEASQVLQWLDTVVCGLLFLDFIIRFRRAEDKRSFMKLGWIDLVASIPNIDLLRWGRMIRVLRVIRILRGIRSLQKVLSMVCKNRVKGGLGSVLTTSFLMIIFASVAILMCETGIEANIKTAEDAVWWSITTITTVGYGDKYPTTVEGRFIAVILMISGVGLFGTLSGLIASYFLGSQEQSDTNKILAEIQTLQKKVDGISKKETFEIQQKKDRD